VFVDFDGTIVPRDVTDTVLETFADASWLEIEADWKAGKIGSRECLARQVALIKAKPEELDGLIASIDVDPGFPAFVEFCRNEGLGISVLSDGLDRAIRGVLARYKLDLPFAANALEQVGDDGWKLSFPHMKPSCVSQSGNCKCAAAMAKAAPATVMVGDGRSDFCISNRATYVLAKGSLATHCETNNLPHSKFNVFDEATILLKEWLADSKAAQAEADATASSRRKVIGS
jgi:2,3-diketo-5-methylthio-1-phosphopentane phosphatase